MVTFGNFYGESLWKFCKLRHKFLNLKFFNSEIYSIKRTILIMISKQNEPIITSINLIRNLFPQKQYSITFFDVIFIIYVIIRKGTDVLFLSMLKHQSKYQKIPWWTLQNFISHSDYDLIISIHREPGNSKSRIVKERSHPRNRNVWIEERKRQKMVIIFSCWDEK